HHEDHGKAHPHQREHIADQPFGLFVVVGQQAVGEHGGDHHRHQQRHGHPNPAAGGHQTHQRHQAEHGGSEADQQGDGFDDLARDGELVGHGASQGGNI